MKYRNRLTAIIAAAFLPAALATFGQELYCTSGLHP